MLNPPARIDRRGLQPLANFDGSHSTAWPAGDKPESSVSISDLTVSSKTATSVTLSWTGVDEAVSLERATTPGAFTQIQTGITANTSQATDSGASSGTEYHYRLTFASGTSNTVTVTTNESVAGDWVVYSGVENNWRSPFAMEAIYPRPDAETLTNELHRKAHGSVIYRVALDFRGGRWPIKAEIISGEFGATIGSEMVRSIDAATGKILHEPGADYGVLEWDPSGHVGAFSFHVRLTDQAGATLDFEWTGERDDSAFVFADSVNGDDSNTGAFDSKIKTFPAGLWKNSDDDTTFAGKIAVLDGTFDVHSGVELESPALDPSKKPIAIISRNLATLNTSTGHFRTSGNPIHGMTFQGLRFNGSRPDLPQNRIFNIQLVTERFTMTECEFDNITFGLDGGDNPACLFFGQFVQEDFLHKYISVSRNKVGSGVQVPLYTSFDTHHASCQLNTFTNVSLPATNGTFCIQIKDDTSYVTVRHNRCTGYSERAFIAFNNQNTKTAIITDQECCYNTLIFDAPRGVDAAIEWNTQSSANSTNNYDFANTVISTQGSYKLSSSATGVVSWGGNLYVGSLVSASFTATTPESVELQASDFDSSGRLNGSARTTYLGALGAEIAGEAA